MENRPTPGQNSLLFVVLSLTLFAATTVPAAAQSTATSSVSVLSAAFNMPQLNRTHKIWIYLPPDYQATSKSYPVLYATDGHLLFDDAEAWFGNTFFGEMRVDEILDSLHALGDWGVIVVAIQSDLGTRNHEYFPWTNVSDTSIGDEGDQYVDFLASTLKPYVDQNYRTMPGPASTGILGESAGSDLAFYAGLRRPDVFGLVASFSSSFYFMQQMYDTAAVYMNPAAMQNKLYFVSSNAERYPLNTGLGPIFSDAQARMVDTLLAAGYSLGTNVQSEIRSAGAHHPSFWTTEFAGAYLWLYSSAVTSAKNPSIEVPRGFSLSNYPNPFNPSTKINYQLPNNSFVRITLVDVLGREIAVLVNEEKSAGTYTLTWNADGRASGMYFCRLEVGDVNGKQSVQTRKMILLR